MLTIWFGYEGWLRNTVIVANAERALIVADIKIAVGSIEGRRYCCYIRFDMFHR